VFSLFIRSCSSRTKPSVREAYGGSTEVTSRADSQVFVAPASGNTSLIRAWGGADVMTSTNGTVEPAGTPSADKAASDASNRAVAQPPVDDVELARGSAEHVTPSAAAASRPSMPAERYVRQVDVTEHGEVVAVADLEPTDDQGVIRASLHAQAGHLPTGTRTRLVDRVLDLPQTKDGNRLEATLPLGDAESLDRLRERCDEVQTRPAGASCLVDAALLTDADAPELDAATDRLD
jgi:hypothetical protein